MYNTYFKKQISCLPYLLIRVKFCDNKCRALTHELILRSHYKRNECKFI